MCTICVVCLTFSTQSLLILVPERSTAKYESVSLLLSTSLAKALRTTSCKARQGTLITSHHNNRTRARTIQNLPVVI